MITAGYAAIEPVTHNFDARVKAEPALHERIVINPPRQAADAAAGDDLDHHADQRAGAAIDILAEGI